MLMVAALGACKEDTQEIQAGAQTISPALIIDGKTVDPMCFINRDWEEQGTPSYPTTHCSGGNYIANTQAPPPLPDSFISTGYFYVDEGDPPEKWPGMVGYRFLGNYRGLKAVLTMENSGGSGTFTGLHLLRPEKDGTLTIVQTLAGGDRCNGGISDAFMDGHTLVYSVSLTPYDFIDIAQYNPKNLQPYDDLDACAICCYGNLQFVDGRPHALILEEGALSRIQSTPEDEQTTQSCFDELFVSSFKERKTALSMREVRHFVRDFYKTCLSQ
jgi:hypothetical protein